MFNRIHRKLGTAGFIISIVALVAALGGGAYAASGGLSGKQKKEVEKIAKKFAGKPGKAGQPGATGPTGPQGAKGDGGAKGDAGANGGNGADGKSVNVTEIRVGEGGCEERGGAMVEREGGGASAEVCNGETGFTATLPQGQTETGTWAFGPAVGTSAQISISFPIPLAAGLSEGKEHVITPTGEEAVFNFSNTAVEELPAPAACPGSVAEPVAKPGNLCVYTRTKQESTLASNLIYNPAGPLLNPAEAGSTGPSGARMFAFVEGTSAQGWGTWAVTAP